MLTGWLSVDLMMDKYPSISPYAYCAWSPVKLVDPDGRKIRFAKGTTREQQEQFYSAVRYLDAHNCGGRFGLLQSSEIEYTISIDLTATNGTFNHATRTITCNPLLGLETNDEDFLSPATVLNHEMTHASIYDNIFNKKFWKKFNTVREVRESAVPAAGEIPPGIQGSFGAGGDAETIDLYDVLLRKAGRYEQESALFYHLALPL